MLNSIGLQGPGIDAFVANDLAWLAERGARVVVSIAGGHTDEYVALTERLAAHPAVAMIEVNISCPNVESRGQVFACDAGRVRAGDRCGSAAAAVGGFRSWPSSRPTSPTSRPSPAPARTPGPTGCRSSTRCSAWSSTPTRWRPPLGGVTGGLSGPAIRPVAVRCVWQVHRALPHLPILGMGGIRNGLDALQFILAGASAVSVGTAVFGDPAAPMRVLAELERALADRGFAALRDAIGYGHLTQEERAARTPVAV